MTYTETLEYIYARLPMFSRIGAAAYKADLTNTYRLCEVTGNPQNHLKFIHVAGTNGKGSTSHMLAAALQATGYKTGLYTSPHLHDFRERIKINGQLIPEKEVTDFVARMQPVIESILPSFFEITVAMALDYFSREKTDIAIMETGLGGRLDSTNIILPEISVITNIGFDHQSLLGNTLELIAGEKAGIIKPGIPVVIGEKKPETEKVFVDQATLKSAPLIFAGEKWLADDWKYEHHQLCVEMVHVPDNNKETYLLDLPGIYQTRNLVTVLETLHQLREKGWKLPAAEVKKALGEVKKLTGLHGRWEIIHQHPTVIQDVGHNEDGIKAIVSQLELTDFRALHIVIGMAKDKEIEKVLHLLPRSATYYFTRARIPRALPEKELSALGERAGLNGNAFPDVNTALRAALGRAHKEDLILVCGSIFIVGEIKPLAAG